MTKEDKYDTINNMLQIIQSKLDLCKITKCNTEQIYETITTTIKKLSIK